MWVKTSDKLWSSVPQRHTKQQRKQLSLPHLESHIAWKDGPTIDAEQCFTQLGQQRHRDDRHQRRNHLQLSR